MTVYPDVSNTQSGDGSSNRRRLVPGVSVALFVASVAGTVAGIANSPAGQSLHVASNGPVNHPIPFDLIDNRIFVKIYLDGKGPFNFIFDTGADAVITPQVASRLGLMVPADGVTSGVGAQAVATGQATIAKTGLGRYHIRNHKYAVLTIDGTREVFGTVPAPV